MNPEPRTVIEVGHSPDADDAFMFYAVTAGKIETGELEFRHVLTDIETLNRWAMEGKLPVTALSLHAYAYVADRYALLPHGASMGRRYGPIVVSQRPLSPEALRRETIAIPGTLTTAYLALKVCVGEFPYAVLPFDQILGAVVEGRYAAGLLIHEGQLTYQDHGLVNSLDLGLWWHDQTGLPLPLGVNAVRRDLGQKRMRQIAEFLQVSIQYALRHRQEALTYAMGFARGMDRSSTDTFVGMYVNELTLAYGQEGRRAVELLLQWGFERGVLPRRIDLDFVE
ncbi:MAG: ABC transporter substrate-binding protein [candidate division NC10 bacterium]|nr:ABC transporter substrate-binding protein [candidate division NC10 bacterium]